jgi:hypothetical protein
MSHMEPSASLHCLAVPASDHPLILAHSTSHGLDDGVGIRRNTCTIEDNVPRAWTTPRHKKPPKSRKVTHTRSSAASVVSASDDATCQMQPSGGRVFAKSLVL